MEYTPIEYLWYICNFEKINMHELKPEIFFICNWKTHRWHTKPNISQTTHWWAIQCMFDLVFSITGHNNTCGSMSDEKLKGRTHNANWWLLDLDDDKKKLLSNLGNCKIKLKNSFVYIWSAFITESSVADDQLSQEGREMHKSVWEALYPAETTPHDPCSKRPPSGYNETWSPSPYSKSELKFWKITSQLRTFPLLSDFSTYVYLLSCYFV